MTRQHSSVPSQQPARPSIDVAARIGALVNRQSMTRPHTSQATNTTVNGTSSSIRSSNNELQPELARPHKRLRRTTSSVANIASADSHRPSYDAQRPDNAMDSMEPVMMALLQWTENQGLKCPVCYNLMEEAVSLRCKHSFCFGCIRRHLENNGTCPICKHPSLESDLERNVKLNEVIRGIRLIRQAQQYEFSLKSASTNGAHSLHDQGQGNQSSPSPVDAKNDKNEQQKVETFQMVGGLFQSLKTNLQSKMDVMQKQLVHLENGMQQANSFAQQYNYGAQMTSIVPDVPINHRSNAILDVIDYGHTEERTWNGTKRSLPDDSLVMDQSAIPVYPTDPGTIQRRRHVEQFYPELGEIYLNQVMDDKSNNNHGSTFSALSNISSYIETLSQNRSMHSLGRMRYGDSINTSAIVSSIEFSVDDRFFALAGVTRKIKLFELDPFQNWMTYHQRAQSGRSIRDAPTSTPHLLPIREITGPNRISCISWNHFTHTELASADYDGIVTILDTTTGKPIAAYQEHERRAWSVDYSPKNPRRLASGSDDARVKIWSTNNPTSALTILGKANICTVRFSPKDENILTFGCADHYAYCYDLRYHSEPLYTCKGHRKAISCIRYLNDDTFITASTDGSLRSWSHSGSGKCLKTYAGHSNDKHFVGLSVSHDSQWISCGSEDHKIYSYFTPLTQPAIVTPFNTTDFLQGQESVSNNSTFFVSAVAWSRTRNVMLASSSHGEVKMLELSDE
ncbi:WD40-repeat-containing domain protein [Syncephalis plumigaleata]|nr:WD40-repeat-containing domain protein [Syncephalis plumigaleata]